MIIDWHAHVYPPEMADERRWGGESPLTIENLLAAHEAAGIDLCVVSNTIHYLRDKMPEESLAFLRRWNQYGAEIQQKHNKKIVVFTSTLPCGGETFLKELERAIVDYGLKGVLINSSPSRRLPRRRRGSTVFSTSRRSRHSRDASPREKDHRRASNTGQ